MEARELGEFSCPSRIRSGTDRVLAQDRPVRAARHGRGTGRLPDGELLIDLQILSPASRLASSPVTSSRFASTRSTTAPSRSRARRISARPDHGGLRSGSRRSLGLSRGADRCLPAAPHLPTIRDQPVRGNPALAVLGAFCQNRSQSSISRICNSKGDPASPASAQELRRQGLALGAGTRRPTQSHAVRACTRRKKGSHSGSHPVLGLAHLGPCSDLFRHLL